MKYLVTAMIGRRHPLVFYAIGTYAGRTDRHAQLLLWRILARRADRVIACGEEVRDECTNLLRVPAANVFLTANGRDPAQFRPPERRSPSPSRQLCLWVPSPRQTPGLLHRSGCQSSISRNPAASPGHRRRSDAQGTGWTGKAFRR